MSELQLAEAAGTVPMIAMPTSSMLPMTDREFIALRDLVLGESGIALGPTKRPMLAGRLGPLLRRSGCSTFRDYVFRVANNAEERRAMIDAICTNTTSFFREPAQFRFLESVVFPAWRERPMPFGSAARPIRIWSAGCSTGEEPYSIAMSARAHFPSAVVEIVASDLSRKAVERTRSAIWSLDAAEQISDEYRKAFMLRGRTNGKMMARPEIVSMVEVRALNLVHDDYSTLGELDAIFCRNTLIYFQPETRPAILRKLVRQLDPGGYLFLGHSESLGGAAGMKTVAPTIHRKVVGERSPGR
jgi:chemotaxis protein methyltransferase CheR